MKRFLITALIMVTGMSVQAQTVTSAEIKSQIATQLEAIYKKNQRTFLFYLHFQR